MFRTHKAREINLQNRITQLQVKFDTREVMLIERINKLQLKMDRFLSPLVNGQKMMSARVTEIQHMIDVDVFNQHSEEVSRLNSELISTRAMIQVNSNSIRKLRVDMPTVPVVHANVISSFAAGTFTNEDIHKIPHGYTNDSIPLLPDAVDSVILHLPGITAPVTIPEVPPTSTLEMETRNTIDRTRSSSEIPRFHRYFDGSRVQYIDLSDDDSTVPSLVSTSNSTTSVRSLPLHDSDHESDSTDSDDPFTDPIIPHVPPGY